MTGGAVDDDVGGLVFRQFAHVAHQLFELHVNGTGDVSFIPFSRFAHVDQEVRRGFD